MYIMRKISSIRKIKLQEKRNQIWKKLYKPLMNKFDMKNKKVCWMEKKNIQNMWASTILEMKTKRDFQKKFKN